MIDRSVPAAREGGTPRVSTGCTTYFTIGGEHGHLTTTSTPDGRPIGVSLRIGKHGSTLAGLTDALGQAITVGLQADVPLQEYVDAFIGTEFVPFGRTDDPAVPFSTSVIDYMGRRIAADVAADGDR